MKDFFVRIGVIAIVLTVVFLLTKFVFDSNKQRQLSEVQFIHKMNSEKCKLVEVIAPNSAIATTQYKYQCISKSYTLNEDISDALTTK
jgi:hypothetical protein